MGIKGLFPLLKKRGFSGETVALKDLAKIIQEERNMDEMVARTIACDISLMMYKAMTVSESYWMSIIVNHILCFMNAGLIPVLVFDGTPPPEKDAERQERRDLIDKRNNKVAELNELLDDIADKRIAANGEGCSSAMMKRVQLALPKDFPVGELTGKIVWGDAMEYIQMKLGKLQKQSVAPKREHTEAVKNLAEAIGLPTLIAEGEAEIYSSWLCCHKQVGAVWSDDGDILCVGASYSINKLLDGKAVLMRYKDMITELGITARQFRDLCIMLGCDYNNKKNVVGFGPAACWDLIVKYGRIEDIPERPDIPRVGKKIWDASCLDYKNCRRLFMIPKEMKEHAFVPAEMDETEVLRILMENNCKRSVALFRVAYEAMAASSQIKKKK